MLITAIMYVVRSIAYNDEYVVSCPLNNANELRGHGVVRTMAAVMITAMIQMHGSC